MTTKRGKLDKYLVLHPTGIGEEFVEIGDCDYGIVEATNQEQAIKTFVDIEEHWDDEQDEIFWVIPLKIVKKYTTDMEAKYVATK